MMSSRLAATAALLAAGLSPAYSQPEMRLGPVDVKFGASASAEYDDNINGSDLLKESDIILRTSVRVTARMDVTQFNYLEADVELGYRKYLDNSDLDDFDLQLGLTPGAGLRWNIKVGPVKVTLRDALTFATDGRGNLSYDQGTGTVGRANAEYRRFSNTAGVDVGLDVSEGELRVYAERQDEIPVEDEFDYLAQTINRVGASFGRPLRSDLDASIGATFEDRNVDDPVLNDATRWSVGPSLTWKASELLTVIGTVRYASFSFDQGGIVGDASDDSGLEGDLTLRQVLSRNFTHGISWSHGSDYGQLSNTRTETGYRYTLEWSGLRMATLAGGLYFIDAEDSGGVGAEEADTKGLSLGLSSSAEQGLNWKAEFTHERKDSSDAIRDSKRNRLFLGVSYGF